MKHLALLALVPTLLFAQAGSGQPVPVGSGGTGATNSSAARINLGLGNVNNTSDANKPVSIATQAALDLKEPSAGAQAKADAAQAAAIATAATDATTKANAAQAAAIAAAATDATTKANAAQAAAIAASLPASYLDTDATMAANSNTKVPSQAAVRAYVGANATATFSGLSGQPTDNSNLATALNAKQPVPTVAALTSNALVLNNDGITNTDTVSATRNLTMADAGTPGSIRHLDFDLPSPQTITTDFAVFRNRATASANINKVYTGKADIWIINAGGGAIYWLDNLYTAEDLPAGVLANGMGAVTQPLGDNSTKIATTAYVDAVTSGLMPGTYFGWTTSDLANRPANSLVADGTNGTVNAGTFASGAGTWLAMGGGTVATPTADVPSGTYGSTQNVTLSTGTSGASIYYTTNGVDPTTSDTLFSTPVAISATATLKAKAFKTLYAASAVLSVPYTITSAYLINDAFAETGSGGALGSGTDGYDSSLISAVTITGTSTSANPDATDMPGNGSSQVLKITNSTTGNTAVRYVLAADQSTVYIKAKVYVTGFYSFNKTVISLLGPTLTTRWALAVGNSGQLARLLNNGAGYPSTHQFANSSYYYVYIDYIKNGASGVYMSLTNAKPANESVSTDVAVTGTAPNYDVHAIEIGVNLSQNVVMWIEDFQVSTSPIL